MALSKAPWRDGLFSRSRISDTLKTRKTTENSTLFPTTRQKSPTDSAEEAQIKECYGGVGLKMSGQESQTMFAPIKDHLNRLLRLGGIAISFGWNSTGFGKCRGFERLETMLVCHGRSHYDTIVCVERKPLVLPASKRRRLCKSSLALAV